jgi:predicted metal-dependent peptidase
MTMITKALLPDLPADAVLETMLSKSKGRMFFQKGAGFLGSLMGRHKFIWDDEASTAWCDGTCIGINRRFFFNLNNETRVTLVAHELWHTGLDHVSRRGDRDPTLWNYAADYVINLILHNHGYSFQDMNLLLDFRFAGMSTEQVYDILVSENFQPPPNMQQLCEDNLDPVGSNNPQQGIDQAGIPSLAGDIRPLPKSVDHITQMGKLVQARQMEKMSQPAGQPGFLPGELELIIEDFLNPILPWETLLQNHFTELSNDDYSWRKPSRRYEDEYLPSLSADNGLEHVLYAIDVSGSTTDGMVKRSNSEIAYIHSQFSPKRLTIITFDTKIQDVFEFTDEDVFEKIAIHGRGGTNLEPVLEYIEEHRPSASVIFTDLYCKPMSRDPNTPVIWVCVGNERAKVDFGKLIHIPEE